MSTVIRFAADSFDGGWTEQRQHFVTTHTKVEVAESQIVVSQRQALENFEDPGYLVCKIILVDAREVAGVDGDGTVGGDTRNLAAFIM